MKFKSVLSIKQCGFTLIELMVVIMLVGIMATMVQFNASGKRPEDVLQQESARFAAIFEVASEYGMLNNIELGLMVKKDSYQFLGYDGTRWAEIPVATRTLIPFCVIIAAFTVVCLVNFK
jgi:general secretion pathway protein H